MDEEYGLGCESTDYERIILIVILCCMICLLFLLFLPIGCLLLLDYGVKYSPSYSMEHFSVHQTNIKPGVTSTIFFAISLKNRDPYKGLIYEPVKVAFYYKPVNNQSTNNHHHQQQQEVPLITDDVLFPRFYQGRKKRANLTREINATTLAKVYHYNDSSFFRVELQTSFRYKGMFGKQKKRRAVDVGADFQLDQEGNMVTSSKKGEPIDLTSGTRAISMAAAKISNYMFLVTIWLFIQW